MLQHPKHYSATEIIKVEVFQQQSSKQPLKMPIHMKLKGQVTTEITEILKAAHKLTQTKEIRKNAATNNEATQSKLRCKMHGT
jgi:hypothetical protein